MSYFKFFLKFVSCRVPQVDELDMIRIGENKKTYFFQCFVCDIFVGRFKSQNQTAYVVANKENIAFNPGLLNRGIPRIICPQLYNIQQLLTKPLDEVQLSIVTPSNASCANTEKRMGQILRINKYFFSNLSKLNISIFFKNVRYVPHPSIRRTVVGRTVHGTKCLRRDEVSPES